MPNLTAIRQLATAYDYPDVSIAAPERGYRNHSYKLITADGRALNLIQYKRDPDILARIRRLNYIGSNLAKQGLPVRTPIDPRVLKITGRTTTYAGLYGYLPGNTIPWEANTQRHLKLLGMGMAILHRELANMPNPDTIRAHPATDELQQNIRRFITYFADVRVKSAVAHKLHLTIDNAWLDKQLPLTGYLSRLPNQQSLHLDFVRSNILFAPAQPPDRLQLDGLAITGIIDFEKAAWGSPLLDIARTLAFLLVDCKHKTPSQIRKYFLYSGYEKRGQALISHVIRPGAQKSLLEELTDHYLFYDFYKFLRHNPYETLRLNEHYRRTVALLVYRQILTPDGTITKSSDGV